MYNNSVRVLKPFVNSTAKCNDLNPVFISWLWRITYCNKCLRILIINLIVNIFHTQYQRIQMQMPFIQDMDFYQKELILQKLV